MVLFLVFGGVIIIGNQLLLPIFGCEAISFCTYCKLNYGRMDHLPLLCRLKTSLSYASYVCIREEQSMPMACVIFYFARRHAAINHSSLDTIPWQFVLNHSIAYCIVQGVISFTGACYVTYLVMDNGRLSLLHDNVNVTGACYVTYLAMDNGRLSLVHDNVNVRHVVYLHDGSPLL